MVSPNLLQTATSHVQTIIQDVFGHGPKHQALLVYDRQADFTKLLAKAYENALPDAQNLCFDDVTPATILEAISRLSPDDLVVLVQSSSFRLDEFRIRLHLFEKKLKVIEHPHLNRLLETEWETYLKALEYDRNYYQTTGHALKSKIDVATEVKLESNGCTLTYGGPMEIAKLNIGDYSAMKNRGGQFPIGEVFTELKDLKQLNGKVALFAFGDRNFGVYDCQANPIVLEVKEGRIVATQNSVPEFDAVLEDIRNHEGEIWLRELGFGLNRAMNQFHQIRHDVGIFERMCGIHISLGAKHPQYPKEGFHRRKVKYHVDVFAVTDFVKIDGVTVFQNGDYIIPSPLGGALKDGMAEG